MFVLFLGLPHQIRFEMGFVYMDSTQACNISMYIVVTDSKVPHVHVYEEIHHAHKWLHFHHWAGYTVWKSKNNLVLVESEFLKALARVL